MAHVVVHAVQLKQQMSCQASEFQKTFPLAPASEASFAFSVFVSFPPDLSKKCRDPRAASCVPWEACPERTC